MRRAKLRRLRGPTVGVAFKDLGLEQQFGGAAPILALERVRQCWLQRLGKLALLWRVRCQMVASAKVWAAMYEAAAAAFLDTTRRLLQKRVTHGLLRTLP